MQALQKGFARSVYSNEAGWGTSPMVHATAHVDHPIKQGFMGAFEVFVDTIVVCSVLPDRQVLRTDQGLQGSLHGHRPGRPELQGILRGLISDGDINSVF